MPHGYPSKLPAGTSAELRGRALDIATELEHNYDAKELFEFWAKHQKGRAASALLGKEIGARVLTAHLAAFASNMGAAKMTRVNGDIPTAQMYERFADKILKAIASIKR